jgi:hypothetical protein
LRLSLANGFHRCIPSPPEDGNRSGFRNVVFSSIWNSGRWTESRSPVILSAIQHRQNPSESTNVYCFGEGVKSILRHSRAIKSSKGKQNCNTRESLIHRTAKDRIASSNQVVLCIIYWRVYLLSRPPLWSSGQSSWLQIRRPGFDSRHYHKKKSSGSGTGCTQPREYN